MAIKRHAQMIEIAAIAAPLVLVGMTRVAMTPAVASASSVKQSSPAVVVPVAVTTKAPTAEQQRAMEWVRSVEAGPAPVSPLDHPKPAPLPASVEGTPQGPPVPVIEVTPPVTPKASPLAGLKLSTTLRTRDGGGMAAINGKIYRVGDEVRPGCRLVSIDPGKDRVEISLADGTTAPLGREE